MVKHFYWIAFVSSVPHSHLFNVPHSTNELKIPAYNYLAEALSSSDWLQVEREVFAYLHIRQDQRLPWGAANRGVINTIIAYLLQDPHKNSCEASEKLIELMQENLLRTGSTVVLRRQNFLSFMMYELSVCSRWWVNWQLNINDNVKCDDDDRDSDFKLYGMFGSLFGLIINWGQEKRKVTLYSSTWRVLGDYNATGNVFEISGNKMHYQHIE